MRVQGTEVVEAQVRHLAYVVIGTLALAILGFVLLGNTELGSSLSFAYPVALVGTAGGTANAARRVQRLQQESVPVQQSVPLRLAVAQTWLSPIIGGTFAVLLYCVFLAGMLQGEFFPTFACADTPFTDYSTFSSCNPATNADAAMALVWGFVAGFAERFVPNVLDRFIGDPKTDGSDGQGSAMSHERVVADDPDTIDVDRMVDGEATVTTAVENVADPDTPSERDVGSGARGVATVGEVVAAAGDPTAGPPPTDPGTVGGDPGLDRP